jgi:hypothetical protein
MKPAPTLSRFGILFLAHVVARRGRLVGGEHWDQCAEQGETYEDQRRLWPGCKRHEGGLQIQSDQARNRLR